MYICAGFLIQDNHTTVPGMDPYASILVHVETGQSLTRPLFKLLGISRIISFDIILIDLWVSYAAVSEVWGEK